MANCRSEEPFFKHPKITRQLTQNEDHTLVIMVNKKTVTPANEESDSEESIMEEMCVAIDNLRWQNQNLEDKVPHIQQCHHEVIPTDKVVILNP